MFDRSIADEYPRLHADVACGGIAPTRSQRARQSVEARRRARLEREERARRHERFGWLISLLDRLGKSMVARVSRGASTNSSQ